MSNDWDSLSRLEKKEEAQKTLQMLKRQKLYKKIIGFILVLTLFGCMFWFFEIWKEGFMGGLAELRKQGAFKYLPIGFGILCVIALLKRGIRVFYEKYLR